MAARPAVSASANAATASSVSPASSARRAPLSCNMVTASECRDQIVDLAGQPMALLLRRSRAASSVCALASSVEMTSWLR